MYKSKFIGGSGSSQSKGSVSLTSTASIQTQPTLSGSFVSVVSQGMKSGKSGKSHYQTLSNVNNLKSMVNSLFTHVINRCKYDKIIPRESVIRSRLDDTDEWDKKSSTGNNIRPRGLVSWKSLGMDFDK